MKKNKIKSKKGFSLMEAVVAMAIFTIATFGVAMAFSSSYYSYRNSRAIQKNLEEAQYAMNLIGKSLRTSSIIGCATNVSDPLATACTGANYQWIRTYDYSQGLCIDYQITGGNVQQASVSDTLINCSARSANSLVSNPSNLLTGSQEYVTGGFYAIPSSKTSKVVGRVTIFFEICNGTGSCSTSVGDKARVQTSVSLRDYSNSGLL